VRKLVVALLGLLLAGCVAGPPREAPTRIVADAQSGGSALDISPDSRRAASGGWAGQVRIFSLPEGNPVRGWTAHETQVTGLMFLADGRRLVSTGWDGRIRLWDLRGQPLADRRTDAPITAFAPAGDRSGFLVGRVDGHVEWWSIAGRRLGAWRPSPRPVSAVALNETTGDLAAGDTSGRVWRWAEDIAPVPLPSPPSYVRSLVFDPRNGDLLGSGWFQLFRWPRDGGRLDQIPTDHRGIVNHLQFGPKAGYLASISRQTDSSVLLLDPDSGRTLRAFAPHALCGQRVAISPDGRTLVSNSDDASVRFYRLDLAPPAPVVSHRP
jgi:hypothetical protein